jgi:hypothetical protein
MFPVEHVAISVTSYRVPSSSLRTHDRFPAARASVGSRGQSWQPPRAVSACACRLAGAIPATAVKGRDDRGKIRVGEALSWGGQRARATAAWFVLTKATCSPQLPVLAPAFAGAAPALRTSYLAPRTAHRAPRTPKPKFRAMTEGSCLVIVIHGFVPSLASTGPGLRRSAWTEDHVRSPGTCQYWPRAHDPR